MIVKKREKPEVIIKLEALLRRLPSNHPKYELIRESLHKRMVGYKGELSLDYYFKYLPEDSTYIFHGLRLFDGTFYFQPDVLVITQRFIVIIEVKNISGILIFDSDFNQLIRQQTGKEEALPDPILQVERHKSQLQLWLSNHNLPLLPIETFVVISNKNTVIKATKNHHKISSKVIHSDKVIPQLRKLIDSHTEDLLEKPVLKKIFKLFNKKHEEIDLNILQQYKVSPSEILTGVQCPKCNLITMKKIHGGWLCSACATSSKDAHLKALEDYFLLISCTATNQEIRRFLKVDSVHWVSKLLTSLNLPHTGTTGRKYQLK